MKLKQYVENLNELVRTNPEYLELEVISAKDEEGNGFDKVEFEPSLGNYNDEEFTQVENFEDLDEDDRIINSVCIN